MAFPTTPRVPHETPMYEESGAMSRTWIIFFERLGKGDWLAVRNSDTEYKATFGLVRELTVEDDLCLYVIAQKAGIFSEIWAVGKNPCRGAEGRIRLRKKKYAQLGDPPTVFESILADVGGEEGYISLSDGDAIGLLPGEVDVQHWVHTPDIQLFEPGELGRIAPGDILQISCSQIGSVYPGKGYEIVVRWEPLA
jgi:hypothetical protein